MEINDPKAGYIWKLNKIQIIEDLNNRGMQFNASDTLDNLRELLVSTVREKITSTEQSTEVVPDTQQNLTDATSNQVIDNIASCSSSDTDSTMSDSLKLKFFLEKDK